MCLLIDRNDSLFLSGFWSPLIMKLPYISKRGLGQDENRRLGFLHAHACVLVQNVYAIFRAGCNL